MIEAAFLNFCVTSVKGSFPERVVGVWNKTCIELIAVKPPLIGKENDTSSLEADRFHQYCERVALPDRMFISFGAIHIYRPFKS